VKQTTIQIGKYLCGDISNTWFTDEKIFGMVVVDCTSVTTKKKLKELIDACTHD